MHVDKDDAEWMAKALPEGTYRSASDVLTAVLAKVKTETNMSRQIKAKESGSYEPCRLLFIR